MFQGKTYSAILRELYGFRRLGIRPAVGPAGRFLSLLGDPQTGYPVFHVAGTNGKGSTTAMIASSLSEAGFRTGSYYSPHVTDFRERFLLNGRFFPKREITAALRWMEATRRSGRGGPENLTFFEWCTALAFVLFARADVHAAVLETGMGGNFDATNVVAPEVSVITNISLEHTGLLGKTTSAIAAEKAGIIKKGRPVVCGNVSAAVKKVIRAAARRKKSDAYFLGENFTIDRSGNFTGTNGEKLKLAPAMEGGYQYYNAALAAQALLLGKRLGVAAGQIEKGIRSARLPGRFEITEVNGKTIIFDVAHNPSAVLELCRLLRTKGEKFDFVVGILSDKNYRFMLKRLAPFARRLYCITPDEQRAIPAPILARAARKFGIAAVASDAPAKIPLSGSFPLCVTGSFTTVEAMKKVLSEKEGTGAKRGMKFSG